MKTATALLMGLGIVLNGFAAGINLLNVGLMQYYVGVISWEYLSLATLNGILTILCYDYIKRMRK